MTQGQQQNSPSGNSSTENSPFVNVLAMAALVYFRKYLAFIGVMSLGLPIKSLIRGSSGHWWLALLFALVLTALGVAIFKWGRDPKNKIILNALAGAFSLGGWLGLFSLLELILAGTLSPAYLLPTNVLSILSLTLIVLGGICGIILIMRNASMHSITP